MIRLFVLGFLGTLLMGCSNHQEENFSEKKTPHDFMFMQRAYPSGELMTDAYSKAIDWRKNSNQRNSVATIWEFAGPLNVGGRITDIEIPVDQAQTYYVGAASGGIFKTTDAGSNWMPIFDEQDMLSIGDIEISKNDTDVVWVGTGEVNAGGGSLAYDGNGIYRSADGGTTWESKGLPNVGSIGKIIIDPNDDETLFVGAMGPLFRDDSNRGVYRSTDGGDNWSQVLFVSDITGVIDMTMHPTDSDIVYAATWERVRRPNMRSYGGETSRIYRSQDGGDTWNELTSGLPSAPADKGRISIDISISNPNVLYARYANASGGIQGVYRTANGGDTWVERNSSQLNDVGFHWWFRGIFVDPTNADVIYNVDFVVQKSIDGGNTWTTAFPGVHVDQHAMAFNSSNPGEVLLGNDGGFYKSSNDGASSAKDLTLPITQFYRFYVDPQDGNKIYGGAQDNNTIRTTTGGLSDWNPIFGGDGFQPLVDANDTNTIYALSQRGNLGKSTNNAASFSGALNGISGADRNNWDTPIEFDPNDSQTLYYGTQRLYRSTNAAGNWVAISGDLTNGNPGGNLAFGTLTTISVSPFDGDTIYVGTDDGNVQMTDDGGGTWTNISGDLPDLWVTSVYASPEEQDVVYVTFSGYRFGEDGGHVFKSEDNGANWQEIGANLPDIPVSDIVRDNYSNLIIATDIGVLASPDEGANWQVLGDNFPSVAVTDLHIHQEDEILYAATYGRSAYKISVAEDVLGIDNSPFAEALVSMFPNPANNYVSIESEVGINGTISIYDGMGRMVLQKNISEGSKRIDLSNISGGLYYVHIVQGDVKTVKKLIVK